MTCGRAAAWPEPRAQSSLARRPGPLEHRGRPGTMPQGEATGAAALFGATGGVMEAALRTAYELLTGKLAGVWLASLPSRPLAE